MFVVSILKTLGGELVEAIKIISGTPENPKP